MMTGQTRHYYFLLLMLVFTGVLGCSTGNPEPETDARAVPTQPRLFTLSGVSQEATVASPTRIAPVQSESASVTPFPSSTPVICTADPNVQQVRYEIDSVLDYDSKRLTVAQTVYYRNDHDDILDEIVFHAEPRRQAGTMQLGQTLDASGIPVEDVELDGWRLRVPIKDGVYPGCMVQLQLGFTIQIEPFSNSNPVGWLSYTERQLNLAHWFPTVGLYSYQTPGVWYTPRQHFIGEQAVGIIANFDVSMTIQNQPDNLEIAAPGTVERVAVNAWEFRLQNARDYAMSMSTEFSTTRADADGIALELYYFPSAESKSGGLNPAARAMLDARQAVELYNELYGPFPYDRMVIIEGDFPDGLEFSGLVFVGTDWFNLWNGRVDDWLTIITVHEVSHQWWYASVGSNQADTPYLDEALATYSELFYYERYYSDLAEWWWEFRINQYGTGTRVDTAVYDYASWRPYIDSVYLGGSAMFQALRDELGNEVFVQWLADYAATYRGQIASAQDFWGLLSISDYQRVAGIRQQYLRESQILPPVAVELMPDVTATPTIALEVTMTPEAD